MKNNNSDPKVIVPETKPLTYLCALHGGQTSFKLELWLKRLKKPNALIILDQLTADYLAARNMKGGLALITKDPFSAYEEYTKRINAWDELERPLVAFYVQTFFVDVLGIDESGLKTPPSIAMKSIAKPANDALDIPIQDFPYNPAVIRPEDTPTAGAKEPTALGMACALSGPEYLDRLDGFRQAFENRPTAQTAENIISQYLTDAGIAAFNVSDEERMIVAQKIFMAIKEDKEKEGSTITTYLGYARKFSTFIMGVKLPSEPRLPRDLTSTEASENTGTSAAEGAASNADLFIPTGEEVAKSAPAYAPPSRPGVAFDNMTPHDEPATPEPEPVAAVEASHAFDYPLHVQRDLVHASGFDQIELDATADLTGKILPSKEQAAQLLAFMEKLMVQNPGRLRTESFAGPKSPRFTQAFGTKDGSMRSRLTELGVLADGGPAFTASFVESYNDKDRGAELVKWMKDYRQHRRDEAQALFKATRLPAQPAPSVS